MGKDYPLYTADGGVKCYVVEALPAARGDGQVIT